MTTIAVAMVGRVITIWESIQKEAMISIQKRNKEKRLCRKNDLNWNHSHITTFLLEYKEQFSPYGTRKSCKENFQMCLSLFHKITKLFLKSESLLLFKLN